MMKIDDVQIENEIRYDVPEHQTLLSFNCDIQNDYFQQWWEKEGKEIFVQYYNHF
jgi:hypothetical protein